jgi:O-antigen/teichoic acid export membrane protein
VRERLNARLPAGSFLRNVAILTSGTVFAQALMVLALPILARLYTPEDFSLLAVYVAILGIVSVVSCLRYNIAIPLPENDHDGLALLAVSLIAACVISLLLALIVIVAPEATSEMLGQPGLQPYLWMIPAGVFIASAYNALQYWATRKKRFALVTRTRMTRAVGGAGTQLGLGAINPTPFGLLFGHMIYGGLGILGLLRSFLRDDRPLLDSISRSDVLAQAYAYRRFPLYSVPEALFNTAGSQLPLIMIAAMVAGPEAGFLFLAMRVMGLPMGLIGGSVAQVFLAEAPAKLRDGTLAAFTRSTMWNLLKTGAPVMVAIGVISPIAFPLVFGEDWARAGWLVAWMTPWFVLQFVASPVSMVMHVVERQGVAMMLQAAGLLIRVGAVFIAGTVANDVVSEIYAVSGAVFYFIYIIAVYWVIGLLSDSSEK